MSSLSGDLTFSTWWAYADQELLDGFKKKYPQVNIKLDFTPIDTYPTHIQTLASGNSLPDVFAAQSATLVALQKAGQLLDLEDALETPAYDLGGAWGSTFVPTLLAGANSDFPAAATSDGQKFGVPFNAISVAAIYNREIFDKVGVKPATTFDELLGNCGKLRAAGYIPMSLTGKTWIDWWVYLAWDQTMQGGSADTFDTADPGYIKGFEIFKAMIDARCWDESQVGTDIAGETALFLQGKTAQFISVPENFLGSVAADATFPIATAVLPAMDGRTPSRILGGGNANVLVVSAKSGNPEAAIAFAKYLTSVETESALSKTQFTIPSINIDASSSSPLMAAYTEAAKQGFVTSSEYMPALTTQGRNDLLSEVLPAIVLGELTPQQAAAATSDFFQD